VRIRPATIRMKTALAATTVVAIALIVTALMFDFVLRRALRDNVGNSAKTRAEEVALFTQKTKLPLALPDSGEKGAVVQVVNGGGVNVAASAQVIRGARLSKLQPPLGVFRTESRSDLPITGDQKDDPFHVVAFGAQTSSGPITVYVAIGLDGVHETVASVRKILKFAFPILLGVVAATSWFFAGAALRPVDELQKRVGEIGDGGNLSLRVPEPEVNDEIGRLARGMNHMLGRLEESSERQRRFVADASHELQSPLAASLADIEVAIAYPDSTDWEPFTKSLAEDNHRMTRLVSDLLFLARSDSGATQVGFTNVDLDDIVYEEARRWQPRTSVRIDVRDVAPAEVRGNTDQLARVVRNLLENASRYATSEILVGLSCNESLATLVVADDGPGIAAPDRQRVFERFARLDDSRSRMSGGSGLGLAIVRDIVDAHSGTVGIEPSAIGAKFVVRLPLPSSPEPLPTSN
jgi:signal transduction histidine kinase